MRGVGFVEQAGESIGAQEVVQIDPTGRYARFDELLGKGAIKTVYKAIDEVLGIEVAWNQVNLTDLLHSPDDLRRLYSEVHLLSTLNHDSIIRFYTSWIDAEQRTFNFITEMLTSGTLREFRVKYKGIGMRAIKIWARQILEGIVYLHGHDPPVIHRDLKCDNIFVNGHLGQVKIGDLGLAAILCGPRRAHSVIGTPEFMAPELYEENYNELVDVYSYGMCVLEMVTSEYPYSECTNPAQIYKKVTSVRSLLQILANKEKKCKTRSETEGDTTLMLCLKGKKPRAFYKVQDLEAQRFIGKCLEPASKRLSAKDLLVDPFLVTDNFHDQIESDIATQKPFLNANVDLEHLWLNEDDVPKTNMTITGKLNPEDDTIFLKVQIATDKEGGARNVFFPFDIVNDTPVDVANEMVKELDITDWKPSEIANMIDGEISGLVPDWNSGNKSHQENYSDQQISYSSSISSQVSFLSSIASQRMDAKLHSHWLHVQEDLFDDTSSQSSAHSEKYSNWAFHSADENECDMSQKRHDRTDADDHMWIPSRFYPGENSTTGQNLAQNGCKQCKEMLEYSNKKSTCKYKMGTLGLTKNRSLVDTRSQLLHQSLVKEVNRRRLFKTAGDVESIGFQSPYEGFGNLSTQRMNGMSNYSSSSSSSSSRWPSHLKGMQNHRAR